MINLLKPIDLNCSIFSVYDFNGMSMNEILCQFFTKINELVESQNKVVNLTEWLIDQGLKESVAKQLNQWLLDGTLSNIINEQILNEINSKIETNATEIEKNKTNINIINEKINNITIINVKDFGAKGDGQTDDTPSIKKALNSLGSGWTPQSVVLYLPTGNYKLTESIILNRDILTIKGDGIDNTILSPVGNFDCIKTVGSKGHELYSVKIHDLTIYGGELRGKAINWSYAGLHCNLKNISIDRVNGVGLYIQSSFDHIIENIEIRGCLDEGLKIDEIPYPNFEEISYLTFNNVVVVDCNHGGTQYNINGGNNLYFNECKANEGVVGMLFTGGWCNRVTNFYMDGLSSKDTTVFVINGVKISNLTIENVYCWNAPDIINIKKAQSIILKNIDRNPFNAESRDRYDILIDSTFEGKCYVDNKLYNVKNDSQQTIRYQLATSTVGGMIESYVIKGNFLSGYSELDLDYSSSKNIVGVVANLKGDNKINTANGKVIPHIDVDWEGGYFRVKLSLPEGVTANAPKEVQVNTMFIYN